MICEIEEMRSQVWDSPVQRDGAYYVYDFKYPLVIMVLDSDILTFLDIFKVLGAS